MDAGKRAALLSRLEEHYARFEQAARKLDARAVAPPRPIVAPATPEPPQDLTLREIGVLELAAEGFTDREIAAELGIGDQTVKSHIRRVMVKLRARNRTHAVITALRLGMLRLEPDAEPRAA